MRRLFSIAVAALVLGGCALRPRYADFVNKETPGPAVEIRLLADGVPVPGARIEIGESRNKISVTTDADGYFALPVAKQYLDDNPVLVINPPAGVGATQLGNRPAASEVAQPSSPTLIEQGATSADAGTTPAY